MSCVDARVEMLARHKGRPRRLEIDRGALSKVGRRRSSLPRYGRFTFGDWILCKQQLVQFFQGRKVRVSLFLQQQFQATDGTLSLDPGGALPELREERHEEPKRLTCREESPIFQSLYVEISTRSVPAHGANIS